MGQAMRNASAITGQDLRTYADLDRVKAELEAKNREVGASDGRVTQLAYLEEARAEMGREEEAARKRAWDAERAELIRKAEAELRQWEERCKSDRDADKMLEKTIVWFGPSGHRNTRRYKTERGFLRAYIARLREDAYIVRAD